MAATPETKILEDKNETTGVLNFLNEFLIFNPVNLVLTLIISVLMYKIIRKFTRPQVETPAAELTKLRKDMTVAELRQYDGTKPDGRVLLAVNGWIFDVTRGRRFYGPGECITLRVIYK